MDTTTTLADQFQSEVVTAEYVMTIADRNALPQHPALFYAGSVDASGSLVRKVPHIGLGGADQPAATSEGSNITLSSITDGSTTITVSRYSKGYETSDQVRMVQNSDKVGMQPLSRDALQAFFMRLTNLIANVADDFTTTGGPGSGSDLTVASVLAIIGAVAANNISGIAGYMGLLHGQQWSDLIVDGGTSLTGGTQERNPELAALQSLRGQAFLNSWLGVDWYLSNQVPTANAGADRAGAVFGYGAVMWADGRHQGVDLNPQDQFLLGDGRVLFERSRNAHGAETAYIMHGYAGVSKGIEAGITIVSDA